MTDIASMQHGTAVQLSVTGELHTVRHATPIRHTVFLRGVSPHMYLNIIATTFVAGPEAPDFPRERSAPMPMPGPRPTYLSQLSAAEGQRGPERPGVDPPRSACLRTAFMALSVRTVPQCSVLPVLPSCLVWRRWLEGQFPAQGMLHLPQPPSVSPVQPAAPAVAVAKAVPKQRRSHPPRRASPNSMAATPTSG